MSSLFSLHLIEPFPISAVSAAEYFERFINILNLHLEKSAGHASRALLEAGSCTNCETEKKGADMSELCASAANLRHYQYGHYAELGPDCTSPCQTPLHSAASESCLLDEWMTLMKNHTIKIFKSTAFKLSVYLWKWLHYACFLLTTMVLWPKVVLLSWAFGQSNETERLCLALHTWIHHIGEWVGWSLTLWNAIFCVISVYIFINM